MVVRATHFGVVVFFIITLCYLPSSQGRLCGYVDRVFVMLVRGLPKCLGMEFSKTLGEGRIAEHNHHAVEG